MTDQPPRRPTIVTTDQLTDEQRESRAALNAEIRRQAHVESLAPRQQRLLARILKPRKETKP